MSRFVFGPESNGNNKSYSSFTGSAFYHSNMYCFYVNTCVFDRVFNVDVWPSCHFASSRLLFLLYFPFAWLAKHFVNSVFKCAIQI